VRYIANPQLWWLKNLSRIVQYRFAPGRLQEVQDHVQALRRDGILVLPFSQVFSIGTAKFEEASRYAFDLLAEAKRSIKPPSEEVIKKGKDFAIDLGQNQLPINHILMQLALDPLVLSVVNGYLGMMSSLRWAFVKWDRPTEGSPRGTQLWHQDLDDRICIKIFIYLHDVDMETGPFCFIPRTHSRGELQKIHVERDNFGRTSDEVMRQVIPESQWMVCTGSRGTVVLCDTNGFHRGLKPQKERLVVNLQYLSGAARVWHHTFLRQPGIRLTRPQELALA
jgi:ectoine hydroxylase-related dioxygenase (phytanoyl-CoA dioxygenase family)